MPSSSGPFASLLSYRAYCFRFDRFRLVSEYTVARPPVATNSYDSATLYWPRNLCFFTNLMFFFAAFKEYYVSIISAAGGLKLGDKRPLMRKLLPGAKFASEAPFLIVYEVFLSSAKPMPPALLTPG